jgi:secreted PhoX family phosphatase
MFLLDLSIQNPTVNDLIRLTAVPAGAEVTGVVQTPDGKSLLINSQHPRTDNPFPYNHSLTFAIHGLDQIDYARLGNRSQDLDPEMVKNDENAPFSVYPNPVTRVVFMNKTTDVALYDASGKRVLVQRNVNQLDVSALSTGIYYLKNAEGETLKLSVQ